MSRRTYAVQTRNIYDTEHRQRHTSAALRDLERQAQEKAELLERMREKISPPKVGWFKRLLRSFN